ncbi:hypothetical protein HKD37_10G027938 [Glycine soja]
MRKNTITKRATRHPYRTRSKSRTMGDQEETQEQMKADMSALKEQMTSMMEAMLGMRQLMEKNVATAAAAEADPTLLATARHPPSNIVGRGRNTLGHDGNPHLGYNRAAYPYGLPPNYSPLVLQDDAGHIASPVLEREPPQQPDEVHEDPQDYARRDVEFYPPIPEGPAPNTLPQPNITTQPIRWRDLAAQVAPPMVEREMITMMVDTLPVFYYEKLVGYMPSSFADLVFAGERIERKVRLRFLHECECQKNRDNGGKKEGRRCPCRLFNARVGQTPADTSWYPSVRATSPELLSHTGNASSSAPVQPKAPTQREAPQVPTPNTTHPAGNSNATRNFPPRPFQEFTPLPMTYEDLLSSLIANHLAVVTPGKVLQPPFPKWYDPNATCKYHGGAPRHSIEKCLAFKHKVQHLIDAGWLTFQEDRPNVKTNPLANHGGGTVNAVESDRPRRSKPLRDATTPRRFILEALQKGGVIPHSGRKEDSCLLHHGELHDMETCLGVEELLQRMIDQGRLEVSSEGREEQHICMQSTDGSSVAKPKPLLNTNTGHPLAAKPAPFPYQNRHAVPWRYTPLRGKEEEATDVSSLSAKVTNITGLSGVTRSGRVFAPPNLPVQPANVKGKGKVVEEQDDEAPLASDKDIPAKGLPEKKDGKKEVSLEEASEFLQFKVIEQLNKTPARVSLLELLMSSEPHRALLVKVLNEAHVAQDISVEGFGGLVNNITANNYLAFAEEEIPADGRGHNKALHVSVKCMDHIVAKVLIDNGSSLNVMPKSTLEKLLFNASHLKPSSMVVRAFDGTRREVRGEIDLPVQIGPHTCQVTFQIMDINPPTTVCWGVRGSTQWELFPLHSTKMDGHLVIVSGEEDILASCPSSMPYVEAAEESLETAFQSFEVVSISSVDSFSGQACLSDVAVMMARVMLGNGYEPGMGLGKDNDGMTNLINAKGNRGKYGLGYKPTQADIKRSIAGRKSGSQSSWSRQEGEGSPPCHISRSFISAGLGDEGQVVAIYEDDVPMIDAFLAFHHGEESPVVAILAMYDTFYRGCEKSGARIVCCALPLYVWLVSHPFLQEGRPVYPLQGHRLCVEKGKANWDQLLASMEGRRIRILSSCERCPNVPLMGTRGCINYNLVLAIRQLGYPMRGVPSDESITPFIARDDEVKASEESDEVQALKAELERARVVEEKFKSIAIKLKPWNEKPRRPERKNTTKTSFEGLYRAAIVSSSSEEVKGIITGQRHDLEGRAKVEEIQEKMKADMEAIKEKMATMMEAMMSVKKIMEANAVAIAATSVVAKVNPTSPSGLKQMNHPTSNMVGKDLESTGGPHDVQIQNEHAFPSYGLPLNYTPPNVAYTPNKNVNNSTPIPIESQQPQTDHAHTHEIPHHNLADFEPWLGYTTEGQAVGGIPLQNPLEGPQYHPQLHLLHSTAVKNPHDYGRNGKMQLQKVCKKGARIFQRIRPKMERLGNSSSTPKNRERDYHNDSRHVTDLVFASKKIEVDPKRGKFDHPTRTTEKTGANEEGEKEGETYAVTAIPIRPSFPPTQQYHYSANNKPSSLPTTHLSTALPMTKTTFSTNQKKKHQQKGILQQKACRVHPKFRCHMLNLIPYLLDNSMVAITLAKVHQPPFLREYDSNATCACHGEAPGHSIEHCRALKRKGGPWVLVTLTVERTTCPRLERTTRPHHQRAARPHHKRTTRPRLERATRPHLGGLHVLTIRGLHALTSRGLHVLALRGLHALTLGLHVLALRGLHVLALRGLHVLTIRGLHALTSRGLHVLALRGLHVLTLGTSYPHRQRATRPHLERTTRPRQQRAARPHLQRTTPPRLDRAARPHL